MKCPICKVDFQPKRADAKTCGKASCRKKLQRHNAQLEKDLPTIPAADKTPDTLVKDYEAPEAWLERRVAETGSDGWRWIKTGNPAGSAPSVKVPQKWELSDIDQSMLFRGQWDV